MYQEFEFHCIIYQFFIVTIVAN